MVKKNVSKEPYKGVRDFYPEDALVQNYIKSVMADVVEHFGYEQYDASVLEPLDLYKNKTSEEIVNEQVYSFVDRGDREVALRPEMTPTVARMVAARRRELAFPLRLYSIPNVFRYEKPQRGRLREHWQLNCDLFGVSHVMGDVETILVAYEIMRAFGAQDKLFSIRVNHRGIIPELIERIAHDAGMTFPAEKHTSLIRLMDRKEKMSPAAYGAAMTELLGEQLGSVMVASYTPQGVRKLLQEIPSGTHLFSLLETLEARGITNVVHDPYLMRGFDYYTGMIFEVFDTSGKNNRSLFGGGRYDNLLDLFGVDPVPTVGFGMGDVTIRDFLETHGLLPPYIPSTVLYVAVTDEAHFAHASLLAKKLRTRDITVAVDYSGKKLKDQIKTAVKQHVPFLVTVGEREIAEGAYTLKHLYSGASLQVSEMEIGDAIFHARDDTMR
jgi:histidyl-tRNA synthetase